MLLGKTSFLLAFVCREVLTTMELKLVPPTHSLYVFDMILAIPCLKLRVLRRVHLPKNIKETFLNLFFLFYIISNRVWLNVNAYLLTKKTEGTSK